MYALICYMLFKKALDTALARFVRPYVEQLQLLSETDENQVVRIHCLGAIKAMAKTLEEKNQECERRN